MLATYEVNELIKPYVVDLGIYWVGGAKNPSKKADSWFWRTGEPLPKSFGKWRATQPDFNGACLAYHKINLTGDEGLCDDPCAHKAAGYICQFRSL